MGNMSDPVKLPEDLVAAVAAARKVVVLCGAGVSAESGIPTFRDALDGLWSRFDPLQLASPEGFAADPALVTQWYDHRRVQVATCQPNPGHHALAAMQHHVEAAGEAGSGERGCFTLVTQNVDGLHQRAGSRDVIELHGSIHRWRCCECGRERLEQGPAFDAYPPRCELCGGARRPGVVWFGELLPAQALATARQRAAECDLFFALGTSATVEPAASLILISAQSGARTCEINPEATPISPLATWSLRRRTGELLPPLVQRAFGGDGEA